MTMNYTAEELLKRRLAGMLPKVMIDGQWFLIDVKHHELRSSGNARRRIDLDGLPLDETGMSYRFYFEPKKGAVSHSTAPGYLLVVIPHEKILDPVGVAQMAGLKDTALLAAYPVIEKHFASVIYPAKQEQKRAGSLLRRLFQKKKGKGI